MIGMCVFVFALMCSAVQKSQSKTVHPLPGGNAPTHKVLADVYDAFNGSFDHSALAEASRMLQAGVDSYQNQSWTGYTRGFARPHCDMAMPAEKHAIHTLQKLSSYPGGVANNIFGGNLASSMVDLAKQVANPAGANLLASSVLFTQGLTTGAGMIQAAVAGLVHAVPPLIPPPAWNNQPLLCVPMVTGHNCFGAVLYPITMADFVLADVTYSMLDGIIANFPALYASKVGKTNDKMYKTCFSAYMSMHCTSVFPRCSAPQSRDEPIVVGGRLPMCFHLCIMTLVMCPGFGIGDVTDVCKLVSVPPMCSQALYWNLWRTPPQYVSFAEANPLPLECPPVDWSGMDADLKPELLDAVVTGNRVPSQQPAVVK